MLKTSWSTESKTWPGEGGVRVGGSRVGREGSKLDGSKFYSGKVDSSEIEDDEVGKKVQKKSKFKNSSKSKNLSKSTLDFLTPGAKLAFTKLRQVFLKALILYHFNPERHIRIETDKSDYVISGILSQLTLDNSGQWHPVAFISQKMIPVETKYKTHNGEFLAIVEVFKTWKYYLKSFWHEVFVLTNYNNLRQFIDTKSLSSRQVRWA